MSISARRAAVSYTHLDVYKRQGYDYDKAVERCKKKRAKKSHSSDVGEDALLLTVRAAGKSTDNEKEAAPYALRKYAAEADGLRRKLVL